MKNNCCKECPWKIRNNHNDSFINHSKKHNKSHNCHMRTSDIWNVDPKLECKGNIRKDKGYRIHVNLHKKCLSVSQYYDKIGWRVTHHIDSLVAKNITFKVSEPSRQRAIRKESRNVHAYAYVDKITLNK